MTDPEVDLRNRAIDALQSGKLQESEALFCQLLSSPRMNGQALAGIGMIRLTQGDDAGASELFQNALQRGPDADAFYGLGVLAERVRDYRKALSYQQQAIQVNPDHSGARNRLAFINSLAFSAFDPPPQGRPAAAAPPPPPPPAAPGVNRNASAFEVILTGDEKQAKDQAMVFMQRFRMKRRPRLSAYFGSLITLFALLGLTIAGVTARQMAIDREAHKSLPIHTTSPRPVPQVQHQHSGGHGHP